ncbi:putative bifunctional diguanylate cyclase/phosphodiesterase [Oceanisphaera avium]|uniref:Sensor domain-containing phosphodiesterase n=1 Tax=Oceanisphaera avium TaxID=1903694 RepID=A0A1Y0D0T5_9GAMM|nr:sensor domain-containing phosphodiesterase [Oceanisphaera avium]ART80747.1 hypothetical protein CBP12_11775 [Oceanisphaera avium]
MEHVKKFFSYHKSLLQLVHSEHFSRLEQPQKLAALLELCGDLLKTNRVSTWAFSDSGACLSRELYYQPHLGLSPQPTTLWRRDHELYFNALEEAEILFTHHALHDVRTQSLRESYLGASSSMAATLDAPIYDGPRLYGVLCIESDEHRRWHLADIACVTAFADTISLINSHHAWLNSRKQLDYVTYHDDFTGLQNQRALEHRMQRLLASAPEQEFAILWFDIDRLNTINNGLGAATGDIVINEIASRLRDMPLPGKDMVARVVGDEFAMLCCWPEHLSPEVAVATIMAKLNVPIKVGEQQLAVTTSAGVALYPNDGLEISTLLRASESAMHYAKTCGRAQAQFYNQEISRSAKARVVLEQQLLNALENHGLSVFYQPILSVPHQTIASCEALVRWYHPTLGFLTPGDFLPLAYEVGLIAQLDLWVLERVCQDIQAARANKLSMPPVAVNLAADTIMDALLIDKVQHLLTRYSIKGHELEFEMIEDVIKGDSLALRHTLEQLVSMGINLSIDDFGTGYSSLLRLKSLPFTKLKIDRSFIQSLPDNQDDCAITLSVLGLAKGLGLAVVAEGVENSQQQDWLHQHDCHYVQGYKYHRPLAPYDFFMLLSAPAAKS